MDEAGNPCLVVGIVFYTSAKEHTSHTVASALSIFCTLGIYDELWSDLGSYLMAEVVQKVTDRMGVMRVI